MDINSIITIFFATGAVLSSFDMTSGSNTNKTMQNMKNQGSYRLRSQSESAVALAVGKNKHITPTKLDKSVVRSTKPDTPSSSSNVCGICKGIDDIRRINLQQAVTEFTTKIDSYKELSKSLNDSSSTLSHALDTIKHFIIHTEPKETNKLFSKVQDKISTLSDSMHDLSNYVTKLDAIEEFVNKKVENASSDFDSYSKIIDRLDSLESICGQLRNKIDSFSVSRLNPIPIVDKVTSDSYNSSSNMPPPNPNTCVILGDSNTKHVSFTSNTLNSCRVPTFLIEDIDPHKCVGFKKIWIHVGTNNIKTVHCKSNDDIRKHFDTLMSKLNTIRALCPHSKVIVSPIPPTAIPALNHRAILFNKLLFSQRNWFTTLDFNLFCGSDGNLMKIYRCYSNQRDRIHFGSLGIQILTSKVKHCLSLVDTRSYASAATYY